MPRRSLPDSRAFTMMLLAVALSASLAACGAELSPPEQEEAAALGESSPPTLFSVVTRLGGECARYSPGSTCGIAIRELDSGATATYNGYRAVVSASAAKLIWVTAALHHGAPVSEATA